MAGTRGDLIHEYMGVNYAIVYEVFLHKIPELYQQIKDVWNNYE
jgi:uncharacterized protein with HEPN domain